VRRREPDAVPQAMVCNLLNEKCNAMLRGRYSPARGCETCGRMLRGPEICQCNSPSRKRYLDKLASIR